MAKVQIANSKAKWMHEIKCTSDRKCQRNPNGNRFRGVNKCWGCWAAVWSKTGKPYGPSRRLN